MIWYKCIRLMIIYVLYRFHPHHRQGSPTCGDLGPMDAWMTTAMGMRMTTNKLIALVLVTAAEPYIYIYIYIYSCYILDYVYTMYILYLYLYMICNVKVCLVN